MQVKQIHELVNNATKEIIGDGALLTDDLSNLVDVGNEVFTAGAVDSYVNKLVDQIGKVVFVSRPYSGAAPSVFMDKFEYGAVVEKIAADMPEAVENDTWNLEDKKDYSPNVFYRPKVSAKFFNNKTTFEVDLSFTDLQVRSSFTNANQMNAFLTMLLNSVDKSMTVKMDSLIMRTINNFTAATLADAFKDGAYTGAGNTRAINLLACYNAETGGKLTKTNALTNPDFLRYASMKMSLYANRMTQMSKLFNIGGAARFTPADELHCVMLADFKSAANSYLQSTTFNPEFTALPKAETVAYWQGSGDKYDFESVSTVNVKTAGNKTVTTSGVLAVMFDSEALGVCNSDRRVNTNRNPKAEFYTNFYKFDASYFNDFNENYIVFFIA